MMAQIRTVSPTYRLIKDTIPESGSWGGKLLTCKHQEELQIILS